MPTEVVSVEAPVIPTVALPAQRPGFTAPFYPIVYVRGFAPVQSSRQEAFQDAYYGYAQTAVVVREKSPSDARTLTNSPDVDQSDRQQLDLFEGQLTRFMKEFGYVDATHGGLQLALRPNYGQPREPLDPTRSIWISRFYDTDYLTGRVRPITDHANDLRRLIDEEIPDQLAACGVDTKDYKVILIAHSMGGLVCRTLIQNLYPASGVDPASRVHRLVTIASPHKDIELGIVSNQIQNFIVNTFNPADSSMFYDVRMRQYLQLGDDVPLNNLNGKYSPERCFCLIGSDYKDYDVLLGMQQNITGNYSDGLVKQDHAFIDGAFTANVHRSHSSADHGIVNSFQSYENIHRFLFGDTKVAISLEDFQIANAEQSDGKGYYNIEFRFAVRGASAVYLHDRREDPCENAIRLPANNMLTTVPLHTAFLTSHPSRRLEPSDPYLHFVLALRVTEHQVKPRLLWDTNYPPREIYSETVEVRINPVKADSVWNNVCSMADFLQYQWLSDTDGWRTPSIDSQNGFHIDIPLRVAGSVTGKLRLVPDVWDATK